jgi:hypothetical protein
MGAAGLMALVEQVVEALLIVFAEYFYWELLETCLKCN